MLCHIHKFFPKNQVLLLVPPRFVDVNIKGAVVPLAMDARQGRGGGGGPGAAVAGDGLPLPGDAVVQAAPGHPPHRLRPLPGPGPPVNNNVSADSFLLSVFATYDNIATLE